MSAAAGSHDTSDVLVCANCSANHAQKSTPSKWQTWWSTARSAVWHFQAKKVKRPRCVGSLSFHVYSWLSSWVPIAFLIVPWWSQACWWKCPSYSTWSVASCSHEPPSEEPQRKQMGRTTRTNSAQPEQSNAVSVATLLLFVRLCLSLLFTVIKNDNIASCACTTCHEPKQYWIDRCHPSFCWKQKPLLGVQVLSFLLTFHLLLSEDFNDEDFKRIRRETLSCVWFVMSDKFLSTHCKFFIQTLLNLLDVAHKSVQLSTNFQIQPSLKLGPRLHIFSMTYILLTPMQFSSYGHSGCWAVLLHYLAHFWESRDGETKVTVAVVLTSQWAPTTLP
jgi:hypothetical protein